MYALVANGIATICKNHRQLQALISLYPYPKFQKCNTAEEARRWLREHARGVHSVMFDNYGDTATTGYVTVKYQITKAGVRYDLDTSLVGYIKVHAVDGALVSNFGDMIYVEVSDVKLDDDIIVHHLLAIKRILRILGEFVDVNLVVPDISIYLAIRHYAGSNYIIKSLQHNIEQRLGAVAITIREERLCGQSGEASEFVPETDGGCREEWTGEGQGHLR